MYQVIIIIHILLGLGIIGLVLMQQGKGADAGATFGGGASGSVFGAQGAASFLSRTTAILATLFFITSLGLAWINSNRTGAAVDFMGTATTDKVEPEIILPKVDAGKTQEKLPASLPDTKESVPVPPAAVAPAIEQKPEVKADLPAVVEEKESELKTEAATKKPATKK